MRTAAFALAALLLAGCGFHLRGEGDVPDAWRTVSVVDRIKGDPAEDVSRVGNRGELRRQAIAAFAAAGFDVQPEAPVTVELLGESYRKRTASIGANARAAEYRLDCELVYRIVAADGSVIVAETHADTERSYRFDEASVMGSGEEEQVLRREMRRELIGQLVRQYRRIAGRLPATPDHAPVP